MSEWWADIESRVFNIIKTRANKVLKTKYPKIFWTSQIQTITESQFPCVYIHMIDSYEIGEDLERLTINGVNVTMQVETYVNTDQVDANSIMAELVAQLKRLRFNISGLPTYTSNGNVFRGVVRARRIIAAQDNIDQAP